MFKVNRFSIQTFLLLLIFCTAFSVTLIASADGDGSDGHMHMESEVMEERGFWDSLFYHLGSFFGMTKDTEVVDSKVMDSTMSMEMEAGMTVEHSHDEQIDVTGPDAPTVSLAVSPDPKSGWNVKIDTTNFEFAPERASLDHVSGEGHAHIYVDGVKISRVYGQWFYLDNKFVGGPGEHEVKVNLNANDHSPLAVDGEEVSDTQVITVAESN